MFVTKLLMGFAAYFSATYVHDAIGQYDIVDTLGQGLRKSGFFT